ncbi:MAG: hypothetical protein F4227_01255 [Gammaproteobacteria bacterium]|nr:hypothetical protein [Gammaproteobacteria bacterium]MYF01635.1 hypothetical protein [Gammaproteobacteria bacterium]
MNDAIHNLAVIDFETTGFRSKTDRVVEVGIVFVDPNTFEIVEEWDTLINPMRDVGPTQIHGITASMVEMAPTFDEIVGLLCAKLHSHILVSHNLPFDKRFLGLELDRLSVPFEFGQGYCTLQATGQKLTYACSEVGYSIDYEHNALSDARATTALLPKVIDRISNTTAPFEVFDSDHQVNSRTLRRETISPNQPENVAWKRIVSNVQAPTADNNHAQYLYLLDYVLIDRIIDDEEEEELSKLCRDLGIGQRERKMLDTTYVESVVSAAARDNVITLAEHELIQQLKDSLNVKIEVPRVTSGQSKTAELGHGTNVCFTGESVINGEHYTRTRLEGIAKDIGIGVTGSVTKSSCDVLVASDVSSQSSKAKNARKFGIPIISVEDFLDRFVRSDVSTD